jgi:hypothetical protein
MVCRHIRTHQREDGYEDAKHREQQRAILGRQCRCSRGPVRAFAA